MFVTPWLRGPTGIGPQVRISIQHVENEKQYRGAGQGVCLTPELMFQRQSEFKQARTRTISDGVDDSPHGEAQEFEY